MFSLQRGCKLGYSVSIDYEERPNLKKHRLKDSSAHANEDLVLKRIKQFISFNNMFKMMSETDDGLSSCSNFQERFSTYEV